MFGTGIHNTVQEYGPTSADAGAVGHPANGPPIRYELGTRCIVLAIG